MLMQSTRSAPREAPTASSTAVSGLKATPTPRPCERASAIAFHGSWQTSTWKVTLSPPAFLICSKWCSGFVTIRWQSMTPPPSWTIGANAWRTTGPIVIGSTKCPSPTSKWKTRAPASSRRRTWSPSCVKSAAYSEGSISTVRIQSRQATATILRPQARDEEPRRSVRVRQREQELRPARVPKLGPAGAEVVHRQPARVDYVLVLGPVQRADGVRDRAARPDARRGDAEEVELQAGQRLGAPAQVRPRVEDAEPRAGRVDEHAVEGAEPVGELERVGVQHRQADAEPARVRLQLAHAALVLLDRDDVGAGRGELRRLPARCGAEVEHPLARPGADGR